jgi:hypothetical protein
MVAFKGRPILFATSCISELSKWLSSVELLLARARALRPRSQEVDTWPRDLLGFTNASSNRRDNRGFGSSGSLRHPKYTSHFHLARRNSIRHVDAFQSQKQRVYGWKEGGQGKQEFRPTEHIDGGLLLAPVSRSAICRVRAFPLQLRTRSWVGWSAARQRTLDIGCGNAFCRVATFLCPEQVNSSMVD